MRKRPARVRAAAKPVRNVAGSKVPAPAPPLQNHAFVANLMRLPVDAFEVAPGHTLRRATAGEVAVIRETAASLIAGPKHSYEHLWEIRWPPTGVHEPLPENEWRYFVIAFTGSNAILYDVQAAFDLSTELEIVFTLLQESRTITWHSGRLFHVLQLAPEDLTFFRHVSAESLQATRDIYDRLQRHDPGLIDVRAMARQVGDLKTLPSYSPLVFVGYFAILESLLTHSPIDHPYDSITRQVKQKIALLDNRWTPRLDYGPFGGLEPDKVWTKMYKYRSTLAHGDRPDFTRGDLAPLGSPEQALLLIKETVKAALRFTLIEPQLIVDLQTC